MVGHSDAGIKLGIEGEREFKKGLKDINDTMKVLGSEMTLVASKFDKQDKSVQALNARNSVLNREISEQKNKIDLLQKALANATLSFGEADSRTKAWQEKLNKAQAELNGMERELDQNNKALKNAGEEYDDAGKESKKFGEEVKDSGEKAEKSGHKLETLGKIAKGLGVAFTAAFAAMGVAVKKVVGVIGDCVDVYADFDDSMRQVAATMGMSADEIGQAGGDFERLAQAAKDAGASTRYTASDAADALNYLALAGYDTNKAIETMPKVLTLAAAGGMDLAYASDMVTDSMSALNLQTSDLDMYMDQMAKTSQKSNTSVQQLGEAILVCGGTASLTGQDLDVVNTALGVMADNGIKGSEGGTKLRNVLLSLSSPTKNGAAELQRLGVSIYDAEGNMRQLDAIMGDLNKALSSLSQEEKTAAILSVLPSLLGDGIPMLLDWLGSFLLEQLPVLIGMAGSLVTELVGHLSEILVTTLPQILSAVFRLIDSIIAELPLLLQQLLPLIFTLVEQLLSLLVQLAPEFLQVGLMLFNSLIGALEMICSQLLPMLPSLIQNLCSLLTENLPLVISAAAELYSGLVRALPAVAQQLLPMIPVLILTIGQILIENTPLILEAGTQLLFALLDAIPVVADALISSLPLVWQTIKQTLLQAWPIIRDVGGQLLDGLIVGIGSMIGKVWDKVKEVGGKIIDSIKNALGIHSPSSVFAGIGENLMLGLWNGISDSVGWILDKVRDFGGTLIDTVKSVFGIASPSKVFADEIGKNLGLGVGVGFEDAMRDVSKDMATAIPTDFDVAANVHGAPEVMPGSSGGISLTLNIENFHNYRTEDINELADELSVILASKMNRKAAAF